MNVPLIILLALAVYRVSLLITQEDGPFSLALRLRNQFIKDGDWLAKGIRCVWCVSFWLSLVAAVGLWLSGNSTPEEIGVVWLGMAGLVVFIDKLGRR